MSISQTTDQPETVIDGRTDREILLSIESQLAAVGTFLDELRPLLAAGAEITTKLGPVLEQGPAGIIAMMMGRG